ncbi:MAG TPA: hypothetical protein VNE00_27575 [Paraburkholderia sp.]|jgi:hypothetical protein|nr:hypothetical protein [Paraburkholderia sp.]
MTSTRAKPTVGAFRLMTMLNFLLGLFWNLALLAVALCVCCALNCFTASAAIDACRLFALIAAGALALDAALTFLVFADAQPRYGRFSTGDAFAERAPAYMAACAAALYMARRRAVRRHAGTAQPDSIHLARISRPRLPS